MKGIAKAIREAGSLVSYELAYSRVSQGWPMQLAVSAPLYSRLHAKRPKAAKSAPIKSCAVCSKPFSKPEHGALSFDKATKTCSPVCSVRYRRALAHKRGVFTTDAALAIVALIELKRHPKLAKFTCAHCGSDFEHSKRNKYCSQRCAVDGALRKYFTPEEVRESRRLEKAKVRASNLAKGLNTNGLPWAPKKKPKPAKIRACKHCGVGIEHIRNGKHTCVACSSHKKLTASGNEAPQGMPGTPQRKAWNERRNRSRRMKRNARGLLRPGPKVAVRIQNGDGPTNIKPGQCVEVRL